MATIRVTCPSCGKALEVGAEYDGKEVECGECLQIFVAKGPGSGKIRGMPSPRGKIPAARPSTPPARRRRDDDDDYEHDRERDEYDEDDYEPRSRSASSGDGASGIAVVGLIFGVIALCCPFTGIPLGILAMIFGSIGKRSPGSHGIGTAAIVLGSVGFLISAGIVVWLFAADGWGRIGK